MPPPAACHTAFLKAPVPSTRGHVVHVRTQPKPYELSATPRIAQGRLEPNYWARLRSIMGNSGIKYGFDPVKLMSSIIHIMIYAKRCATHVATRKRKIRPDRDSVRR